MTFDGKSETFELFEDLFHTMIKMQPEIQPFSFIAAKKCSTNIPQYQHSQPTDLKDVLIIFRRKYVKPESQATTKHKWHRLVFDPNTTKLPDFLEEFNQGAEKVFGDNAQKTIDSLLYAKLPSKLKKSVNMARLEDSSYDEIVAHLERELELNALEESDDLPMASMTSSTTKTKTVPSNAQMSDITCNYCKEKGHMAKDCEKLRKKKKMPNKAGQLRKTLTLNVRLVARRTTLKKDVGKGQVHLKPKRYRPEDSSDNDPDSKALKPHYKSTSSSSQSSSSKDDPKN